MYASPNLTRRKALWSYLAGIRRRFPEPWLLIGDFNEICLPSEVVGGEFSQARAMSMLNMMDDCELMDFRAIGTKFTWERQLA